MSRATGVAVGVGATVGAIVGAMVGLGVGGRSWDVPDGVGVGPADGVVDSIGLVVAVYGGIGVGLGDDIGSMTWANVDVEFGDCVASTVGVAAGRGNQSGAPTARPTTARQAARPAAIERDTRMPGRRVRTIGRSAINA